MDFSQLNGNIKKKAPVVPVLVVDFVNKKILYRTQLSPLGPIPEQVLQDLTRACELVGKIRCQRIKNDEAAQFPAREA